MMACTTLGDEQVGGLDVPMHDAGPVGFSQPLADLHGDVESVIYRHPRAIRSLSVSPS